MDFMADGTPCFPRPNPDVMFDGILGPASDDLYQAWMAVDERVWKRLFSAGIGLFEQDKEAKRLADDYDNARKIMYDCIRRLNDVKFFPDRYLPAPRAKL